MMPHIIMMKKIEKGNIFVISFMLLFVGITRAAASPYQDISKIAIFLQIFLLINTFMLAFAFILIFEVRKISGSMTWNHILMANLFTIFHTITLAMLLNERYSFTSINILILIATLYTIGVCMVDITEYLLIKPLLKKKPNLMRIQYALVYITFFFIWFITIKIISIAKFPGFQNINLLFLFLVLYSILLIYFMYSFFYISKSFQKVGFVHKPFLTGGIGGFSIFIMLFIILFTTNNFNIEYYYILISFIASAFAFVYYLRFAIDYPSILQPKWKALMPFDLPKVTAAMTLALLAVSLYFTAKEYPNFIIYQDISYILVIASLLPLLFGIILPLTYLKTLSARTKLRYWDYLKYDLYIHLIITFYVLSLIFLSWNNATSITKMLSAMFGLATFAFYMFFAFELRKIIKNLNIKQTFDRLDISRYIVSLCSFFLLIFFGISFTYGKTYGVFGFELISYPVILFLIAFSLVALWYYLSVTHKELKRLMGRANIWCKPSYIAAFIAFLLVYLIYTSSSTYIQRFPLHDLFFIGYFLAMVCGIVSIMSLGVEPKYKETGEDDIVSLLNSCARQFLRTDILEGLWETAVDSYVQEDEELAIQFDPSERRFDLENADEPTKQKIAVGILLDMHKLPDMEKIMKQSIEETKEEIAAILKEKVLMLPEDLRSQFDVDVFYPRLLEKVVNKLIIHLETFIPFSEQEDIFKRLNRKDEKYRCIRFDGDEIRIEEGTRISRDEFFALFKFYLEFMEDKFPFKPFLLYELVREEIKKELEPYDITVGNLLDIVPTGLEEIDKVMGGGLAKGSSTLLIAEETRTKHKILLTFIKQGLISGTNVIYATAKRPAKQIQGELLTDIDELKNFMILDLYEDIYSAARVYKIVEEEHRIIVPLNKIMFQRSIVKTIKSHPRDLPKVVVIDVYDNLSRYYSPEEVQEILQDQIDGLKRWNCTCVIVLDPYSYLIKKVGDEEVKKNFDNVMILSGDEKDASVFIEKLYHGTPSKPFIRLQ
ncbi:RecA-superfamily ATPase [Methanophagales archaeon]|nr:RecA-superfamily ATPase [Methanophagales archaeon]